MGVAGLQDKSRHQTKGQGQRAMSNRRSDSERSRDGSKGMGGRLPNHHLDFREINHLAKISYAVGSVDADVEKPTYRSLDIVSSFPGEGIFGNESSKEPDVLLRDPGHRASTCDSKQHKADLSEEWTGPQFACDRQMCCGTCV